MASKCSQGSGSVGLKERELVRSGWCSYGQGFTTTSSASQSGSEDLRVQRTLTLLMFPVLRARAFQRGWKSRKSQNQSLTYTLATANAVLGRNSKCHSAGNCVSSHCLRSSVDCVMVDYSVTRANNQSLHPCVSITLAESLGSDIHRS